MLLPLVSVLLSAFCALDSASKNQYSDLILKVLCGKMTNQIAESGVKRAFFCLLSTLFDTPKRVEWH